MREHIFPKGTQLTFEGEAGVFELGDHNGILECEPGCQKDHDHWPEPHIAVSEVRIVFKPLSQVRTIFGLPCGKGRSPTKDELK